MAAVGTIHQPPCVCFCFFLNQDFLVISLEKKKCVGVGVGAGGRSEGGGVATFFLFTRISTPDTPRLAPPPPRPVVWLQLRVQVALQASGGRVPCRTALLPAPRAWTPHGRWGAPSPPCPQGRAQAAAAPVQVPSGLLTLHTLTHIPRPSTLSLTLSAHTPPPSRPRPGRRPPQP